jgi:23S rRNA pseudouridine1911/1915/1917 synthase
VLTVRKRVSGRNTVFYQDKDFLVVEKGIGVITLNCSGSKGKKTLQNWLENSVFPKNYFLNRNDDFSKRSGIVHRLDKDTSGLVLVAKNQEIYKCLQDQFKERRVKKTYRSLVVGNTPSPGTIFAPIKRTARLKTKFSVFPEGKEARTDYKVIDKFKQGETVYSYLEVYPLTGRTHQIRVHLNYLGYPIVGDPLYGYKTSLSTSRMLLHALAIDFYHPVNNNQIGFRSQLPKDFLDIINQLSKTSCNNSEKKTKKTKKKFAD